MIKKISLMILCATVLYFNSPAQIKQENVCRVINVLASDAMMGRKVYSPEIDKAATFIASEFKKAGLKTVNNNSYLQNFSLINATQQSLSAKSGGTDVNAANVVVITDKQDITITHKDNYVIEKIADNDNLFTKVIEYVQNKKNKIILVDKAHEKRFSRIASLKRGFFSTGYNTVFVLGDMDTKDFSIHAVHHIKENKLANVVGAIPGKSRKDEYVIFSGHYDHIGIGEAVNGDSIYNGANDDASGTTAVIELAKYYAAKKNNERTILFVAFTAEETGGFGSQYFSQQLPADKVVAMCNIEMIGTDSKWGKNSAYITGYDKSSMGEILQKNLKGSGFTFYPDPYPDQQLFYRSDNATLARLGVPAHTISTSKMDNEPNYHKPSDEVKTLDLKNMTEIIKSIALSTQSIISGADTPTRVNTKELN